MKFISKNNNLRIVLAHGMAAEPLTGRQAVPGKYVKFEAGVAVINDDETIQLMLRHPGFNSDFISTDDNAVDPYRRKVAPIHEITELKYGSVVGKINPRGPIPMEIQDEIKKVATELAKEMVKEQAPKMAMDILKGLAAKQNKKTKDEKKEIIEKIVEKFEERPEEEKSIDENK